MTTVLLEFPVYYFAFKETRWTFLHKVKATFLVNLSTHPLIYFVLPWIFFKLNGSYYQTLTVAELLAPAVECLLLRYAYGLNFRRSFIFALAANLFSWWAGIYLSYG